MLTISKTFLLLTVLGQAFAATAYAESSNKLPSCSATREVIYLDHSQESIWDQPIALKLQTDIAPGVKVYSAVSDGVVLQAIVQPGTTNVSIQNNEAAAFSSSIKGSSGAASVTLTLRDEQVSKTQSRYVMDCK